MRLAEYLLSLKEIEFTMSLGMLNQVGRLLQNTGILGDAKSAAVYSCMIKTVQRQVHTGYYNTK